MAYDLAYRLRGREPTSNKLYYRESPINSAQAQVVYHNFSGMQGGQSKIFRPAKSLLANALWHRQ